MSRTNCDHCNALVTPGAPFCLTCFIPFEEFEPPAPVAAVPEAVPVPAAVGAQAAAGGNDFYAPPPTQFQSHPGENVDWRVTAPTAALLTTDHRKDGTSRTTLAVLAVVGVLLLVGTVLGGRALLSGPSEKEQLATAFREARPPDLMPSLPDFSTFTSNLSDEPEYPGQAKAYVQSIDAQVRAGNDALLDMQRTMDRWADGKVTDAQLRAKLTEFSKVMEATASNAMTVEAPTSTHRGILKLSSSVSDYRLAVSALLDWLDSQQSGARLTYRITIGSANLHWDEGIINLYRAAELPAPPLPHPQPKKK